MMFRYDLDDPKTYPFLLKWYGQPTAKARAFGLEVWLPDGYDDQDYRVSWRDELRGKITMTDEELDEIFDFRVVR